MPSEICGYLQAQAASDRARVLTRVAARASDADAKSIRSISVMGAKPYAEFTARLDALRKPSESRVAEA